MHQKIPSAQVMVILVFWLIALGLGAWFDRLSPEPLTQQDLAENLAFAAIKRLNPPSLVEDSTEDSTFEANPELTLRPIPANPPSSARGPEPVAQRYQPLYEISWADPSNYGERFNQDINGNPVYNVPIVVLHETVGSADSAINFFQTPHPNEDDQASYHTLIRLNGTVIYVVPPEKRAFGAGNSVFNGPNGPESVKTHRSYPPSVNNFAYHVSLETPPDGRNDAYHHSGYTEAQYQSLAWLIAQSTVPDQRITTHRAVDRSGERIDPRSFEMQKFLTLLHQYRSGHN